MLHRTAPVSLAFIVVALAATANGNGAAAAQAAAAPPSVATDGSLRGSSCSRSGP